jgi:large subunit ribosomal protein L23
MPQVDIYNTIERPIITEKALAANGDRRYAFVVNKEANKIQIKAAVEQLFTQPDGKPVNVTAVNTLTVKGKEKRFRAFRRASVGRTRDYKKALVTLAEGQSIQIFEGV